jgi:hypothetical protein
VEDNAVAEMVCLVGAAGDVGVPSRDYLFDHGYQAICIPGHVSLN